METARFGSPLALVHERFIFALGGFTKTNDQTMECEAFDTHTNHWFRLYSLPYPVANTSAVVMNNQKVYLMPGKQTNAQNPRFLMISVLDCGPKGNLNANQNSREYGYTLAEKHWGYVQVDNPDFIRTSPVAAIQLNENEMMIFGGETTKTFIFNTREVNMQTKHANVITSSSVLDRKARFGFRTDYVCRTFGTLFYAIDASEQVIHTHEISGLDWYSDDLAQFDYNN